MSREGCGRNAIFTNAEGSRIVELTMSAGRRRGNYDSFPDLWEEDAHRYVRLAIGRSDGFRIPASSHGKRHPAPYGQDKLFRLLIFVPRECRAHSLVGRRQGPPFPCHTFARHFFRTFSVLLPTYPISRVFAAHLLLCSLPAWYQNPAGKFIIINHLDMVPH